MKTSPSKTSNRLVTIFAHFDASNRIDESCLFYLKELREISDTLVFVSTSNLPQNEQTTAKIFCDEVICKPNEGLDFCSYKKGLEQIKLEEFDTLLLANDSVYGPIYPLEEILTRFYKSNADFYGITFNNDPEPHIQSYFMLFTKKIFTNFTFKEFWKGVKPLENKKKIIQHYEIGLSKLIESNGFKSNCLYNKTYNRFTQLFIMVINSKTNLRFWRFKKAGGKLIENKPLGFNPLHFQALKLVKNHKVPFIKKELILKNPAFVNLNWLNDLKQIETKFNSKIVQILKRTKNISNKP